MDIYKIEIGDTVMVYDPEQVYTSFEKKFKEFGFKNTRFNDPPKDTVRVRWKVFGVDKETVYYRYAIRSKSGHELYIHQDGIRLHSKKIPDKFKIWF